MSTEPLNIIINDSDTRPCKSNQLQTRDKSSNLNDTVTSQNKGGTNQKKDTHCRRFNCKKYRGFDT